MNKKVIFSITGVFVLVACLSLVLAGVRAGTNPDEVVVRFYSAWIALVQEDVEAPITQELHKKSTYTTDTYGTHVARQAKKGNDAVLCGVVPAGPVEIDLVHANEERTHATVFARIDGNVLRVSLVRDSLSRFWRIDEVECP